MSAGYYFEHVSASFASHVFCITNFCITNVAILVICFSAMPDKILGMYSCQYHDKRTPFSHNENQKQYNICGKKKTLVNYHLLKQVACSPRSAFAVRFGYVQRSSGFVEPM